VAVAAFIIALGVAVIPLAWQGIRTGQRWALWTAFLAPVIASDWPCPCTTSMVSPRSAISGSSTWMRPLCSSGPCWRTGPWLANPRCPAAGPVRAGEPPPNPRLPVRGARRAQPPMPPRSRVAAVEAFTCMAAGESPAAEAHSR
jgi:hypothetical protein